MKTNFDLDDIMAAILYVSNLALSWSQFCFDFLKKCWLGRKLSPTVLAFLENQQNPFSQNGGPRFRKNIIKNLTIKFSQVRY